ncbi:EAL domain-containing protein [Mesorhizobium marinum]|uniref:EAL domain-containing protein n=1 Tax=Mesorhizobium marinum TaxID=3228790 RepID=UPI003465C162
MSSYGEHAERVDDAIIADEVGIQVGCYGIYRLRCLYQPVFERRARTMHAVAVEGVVAPYVAGEEVPRELFLAAVAEGDLRLVEGLELALPLRNTGCLVVDALELVVGAAGEREPQSLFDSVRFIADQLAAAEIDPQRVVCAIGEVPSANDATLSRLAEDIRRRGMRVAINDFGTARWSDGQMEALAPDTVRMEGGWFRKICRDAVTVRLFDSVVARLHERRCKVLVSGIETELQFGVALRAGADLFQGTHLAPPAHVGAGVEDSFPMRSKLGSAANIVPLYG